MPSSEDKPLRPGQIMIPIVMTIKTMMKIMEMREGFIGICVGRE